MEADEGPWESFYLEYELDGSSSLDDEMDPLTGGYALLSQDADGVSVNALGELRQLPERDDGGKAEVLAED